MGAPRSPKTPQQLGGQCLCATGLFENRAQDRSQSDDDCDMPEYAAEPGFEKRLVALDRGADYLVDGQTGSQSQAEADDEKRDERFELDLDDDDEQHGNCNAAQHE